LALVAAGVLVIWRCGGWCLMMPGWYGCLVVLGLQSMEGDSHRAAGFFDSATKLSWVYPLLNFFPFFLLSRIYHSVLC
jgi:hypothetical protein